MLPLLLPRIDLRSNAYSTHVITPSRTTKRSMDVKRIHRWRMSVKVLTSISLDHTYVSFPFHLCVCIANYTCFHAHASSPCVGSFTGDDFLHFCNTAPGTSSRDLCCIDTGAPSRRGYRNFESIRKFRIELFLASTIKASRKHERTWNVPYVLSNLSDDSNDPRI